MEITTLGLDLSLASTGIAFVTGNAISAGTIRTAPKFPREASQAEKLRDADRRIEQIRSQIAWHLIQHDQPSFVYVEAPMVMASGYTAIALSGLHGVVRNLFLRSGLPVEIIYPATLSKHAGIKGSPKRDEKKHLTIEAANHRFGLKLGPKDDDVADAVWLADLAQAEWARGSV